MTAVRSKSIVCDVVYRVLVGCSCLNSHFCGWCGISRNLGVNTLADVEYLGGLN